MKPRSLLIGALLLPIVLVSIDLGVRHTDAYARAAQFVSEDVRVADLIGPVYRVDFRLWHGFTYIGDRADFSFMATSGKGVFIVDVDLRHRPGAWRVQDADIRSHDGAETRIRLR